MKAFNSYLEYKLVDLKNSKIGRESCEKLGMCVSLSERQKREVEASSWIANTPPTEKQISYIKGICEVLEIDYKEPKTKGEATVWLNHFVPFYKRKCEENELEWEANHSDLMDNYGDWSD